MPLTEPVEVTWWTIPASQIPAEPDARLRWLQDDWADVDAWIGRHRPGTGAAAGRSAREVVPPSADP